ncbi:MAG: hypothetical protein IKF05_07045 [Erysipelotrichaceae bacterium]|nr:hypothetical protein [Erysipelotrichaceae bacterium]
MKKCILLLLFCVLLASCSLFKEEVKTPMLLAGDTPQVTLLDKEGKEVQLYRGTEVLISEKEKKIEDVVYKKAYYGEDELYILPEYLCTDPAEVVRETMVYPQYTTMLYESESGARIYDFLPTGTELEVVGYSGLSDGEVDRYKVRYEGQEGYVKGLEVATTKNEWPMPEVHKGREDQWGGGNAWDPEYPDLPKLKGPKTVMPEEVRALYLNRATPGNLDGYLELAAQSDINAFVIDIKESDGVGYQSDVVKEFSPTAYEYALFDKQTYIDAVKKCHDAGLYVIGRIVTFKDDPLVADHPEYALADKNTGQPIMIAGSYWPSPFVTEVKEYNVLLAIEAIEDIGFDEIQFDYVRFPDRIDSIADRIDFRNEKGLSKIQGIYNFLMYARSEIHERGAYLAADVFGEASESYVTAYGQYWPCISGVVDVISAMPYPNHFSPHAYGISEVVWTVPGQLLDRWGQDVVIRQSETINPAKVRTWLQCFDAMQEPETAYDVNMINEQIDALYKNGLDDGYMTWNAPSNLTRYWNYVSAFRARR